MEITKQQVDDLNAHVSIKISENDYAPLVKKELNKARQSAQIKGFRQGMVPVGLLKKMYGQEILVQELNKLMTESLNDFLQKEERNVIGEPIPCDEKQPKIDWTNQKDFEFIYEVAYYPEVNFKLDDSISVPYYKIPVLDTEIEEEIKSYSMRYGKSEDVESSESGDILKIQVTGTLGEEAFEVESQVLIKTLPEEQQAQFLDKKPGDEMDVELKTTFPNDTDLASMLKIEKEKLEQLPATLHFKINEISRWVSAEINQDLFDKVLGVDKVHSEEEFKEALKVEAQKYYDQLSLNRLSVDAQEILLEKANMELPTGFIKRLLILANKDKAQEGVSLEDSIEKELPAIVKSMAMQYISQHFLDQHSVTIEKEEIIEMGRQTVFNRLRQYGIQNFGSFDIEALVRHTLEDKAEMNNIIETIKADKLAKLIKEHAKLDEQVITLEEYNKLYEQEDLKELAEDIVEESASEA